MVEVFGLQQFLMSSSFADEGEHSLSDLRKQETKLWNDLNKQTTITASYKAKHLIAEVLSASEKVLTGSLLLI